ncbi:hypothetical protein NEUTE2DRAFT_34951, partial [Neurospora tetrasperma FGSC 2509]
GSTLNIAILDILKRDFQTRYIYILYNKVKTLQGFIFNTPFNLNALYIISNYIFIIIATNEVRRVLKKLPIL